MGRGLMQLCVVGCTRTASSLNPECCPAGSSEACLCWRQRVTHTSDRPQGPPSVPEPRQAHPLSCPAPCPSPQRVPSRRPGQDPLTAEEHLPLPPWLSCCGRIPGTPRTCPDGRVHVTWSWARHNSLGAALMGLGSHQCHPPSARPLLKPSVLKAK